MSNLKKAAGLSFKIAHPTTHVLTEIAPYFTSISGDASADETTVYLFNPSQLQPTAETIFGATSRTRSLEGYWNETAEALFSALDGMQGVAYVEAPMGTAVGNLQFVGACNFGAWSGPTGDANGQWAMSISLAVSSRKVETIAAPGATVAITSSSAANPTVIVSATHGLETGDVITIAGHTSTPDINGSWVATVLTTTTFTIPVTVTVAGTGGTLLD